jgi:hypothetical protein
VPLCFVYPAMLHYKACAHTRKQKAADIALGVFGLLAAIYTTVQTVAVRLLPCVLPDNILTLVCSSWPLRSLLHPRSSPAERLSLEQSNNVQSHHAFNCKSSQS